MHLNLLTLPLIVWGASFTSNANTPEVKLARNLGGIFLDVLHANDQQLRGVGGDVLAQTADWFHFWWTQGAEGLLEALERSKLIGSVFDLSTLQQAGGDSQKQAQLFDQLSSKQTSRFAGELSGWLKDLGRQSPEKVSKALKGLLDDLAGEGQARKFVAGLSSLDELVDALRHWFAVGEGQELHGHDGALALQSLSLLKRLAHHAIMIPVTQAQETSIRDLIAKFASGLEAFAAGGGREELEKFMGGLFTPTIAKDLAKQNGVSVRAFWKEPDYQWAFARFNEMLANPNNSKALLVAMKGIQAFPLPIIDRIVLGLPLLEKALSNDLAKGVAMDSAPAYLFSTILPKLWLTLAGKGDHALVGGILKLFHTIVEPLLTKPDLDAKLISKTLSKLQKLGDLFTNNPLIKKIISLTKGGVGRGNALLAVKGVSDDEIDESVAQLVEEAFAEPQSSRRVTMLVGGKQPAPKPDLVPKESIIGILSQIVKSLKAMPSGTAAQNLAIFGQFWVELIKFGPNLLSIILKRAAQFTEILVEVENTIALANHGVNFKDAASVNQAAQQWTNQLGKVTKPVSEILKDEREGLGARKKPAAEDEDGENEPADDEEDEEAEEEVVKKPAKRPAKKPARVADDEEEEVVKKPTKKPARKPSADDEEEDEEGEEEVKKPAKKPTRRKVPDDEEEEEEEPVKKPAKKPARKQVDEEVKPAKKPARKQIDEDDESEVKPAKKPVKKPARVEVSEDDEEEEEVKPAKKPAKQPAKKPIKKPAQESDDDDDEEEEEEEEVKKPAKKPARKEESDDEEKEEVKKPAKKPARKELSDDDEEEEEEVRRPAKKPVKETFVTKKPARRASESEVSRGRPRQKPTEPKDDDEEEEEEEVETPKPARRKPASASKPKVDDEEEDESYAVPAPRADRLPRKRPILQNALVIKSLAIKKQAEEEAVDNEDADLGEEDEKEADEEVVLTPRAPPTPPDDDI